MLTLDDVRRVAGEFTYMPGWSFRVSLDQFEGVVLTINGVVPNAYRPEEVVELHIDTYLPPLADEDAFERWLLWRVCRIATHEAREFLRRNGRMISDPHATER